MDEFVFGITLKIRSQKKGMTKTQANDFVGILVVKLHDLGCTKSCNLTTKIPTKSLA